MTAVLVAVVAATGGRAEADVERRRGGAEPAGQVRSGSSPGLVAVDVAAAAGIAADRVRTWSAAAADVDRDGSQDVLVNHHNRGAKLWLNRGDGTYTRVAEEAWPTGAPDRHDCAWADVDRNGRPDAYCAAGRGLPNEVKDDPIDNELWVQGPSGVFRDVGTAWHVGDPCGRGRSVTFLDANGDRYRDLFVGNERPRRVADPCDTSAHLPDERSKLFLNVRGEEFRRAPRRMWAHGGAVGTWCAETLDFNQDGHDDLFACRTARSPRLYENRGGRRFVDVSAEHRLARPVVDADVVDLDRDGDPDLVTASPRRFTYQLNRHGRFGAPQIISRVPHGSVGKAVAAADADGDGDLDVYAMVGNGSHGNPDDRIWLNDGLSFAPVLVPPATGAADDVVVLRPWGPGTVAFLALNGHNLQGRGPVQLIRLQEQ